MMGLLVPSLRFVDVGSWLVMWGGALRHHQCAGGDDPRGDFHLPGMQTL